MSDLDNFTVERLEAFIRQPLENGLTRGEQMALARIALSAKQSEPVAYMRDGDEGREYNGHNEFSGGGRGIALFTTPPANSLVVPEGWKVFKGNDNCIVIQKSSNHWTTLKEGNITTCEKILLGYFSDMLAAAPEKPL
ncbi:Uncharacterised protein [Yersinia rohdei]|uniref:hypothetical protein n=1 Tax=Yersinia rohdei TaxID=29485 RepID=UPI00061BE0B3|nr:hypothetical protein [Yersinia rohdei]CNF26936.1 Uncharacterised protein [Yersinia rohdei]